MIQYKYSMAEIKHLLDDFKPRLYKLSLQPDASKLTFSGQVEITGDLINASDKIVLHSKDLHVWKAYIDGQPVEDIQMDSGSDNVSLVSASKLEPKEHILSIVFDGQISTVMHGLYPCDYQQNGQPKRLLATQFESHHAREVFPCIDEPAAKAVFELTLTTPENQVVVSNTDPKSQQSSAGYTVTEFLPTPKMSTYLLAFICGDLVYREDTTATGVRIRTYTTPSNIDFADFALKTASKTMEFYQQYFDAPYPLNKCDLVALPEFDAGAMENWGCITFRESAMLVDPKNTSVKSKQFVAQVIAHELAHQWFGNLVTIGWWTDLWLNEGFASWMEYFVTDKLFPDWQMWTQFITDELSPAQKLDALKSTHPIEVRVGNPDEIPGIFDAISYSKGACLIRMVHSYLGERVFRDGIIAYLKKFQYANATTNDLWDTLTQVSYKRVDQLMKDWSLQAGFPVLSVSTSDHSLNISQERFELLPDDSNEQTWIVPLYANAPLPADVLDQKQTDLQLNIESKDLLINQGLTGFYRVKYDEEKLSRLATMLAGKQLSPIDRLEVINDNFELAKAGQLPTLAALNFLPKLQFEEDAAVWSSIAENLMGLFYLLGDRGIYKPLQFFIALLCKNQVARVGWEPKPSESYFDQLLRPTVLNLGVFSGDTIILENALSYFSKMIRTEDLSPDIRGAVYRAAIWYGESSAFESLLNLYKQSDFAEELTTIASALSQTQDPKNINTCLELLTSEHVRQQDLMQWLAFLLRNPFASPMAWQWLTANWAWLSEKLDSTHSLVRLPLYAATQLGKDFEHNFKQFFSSVDTPGLERSVAQGLEQIQWRTSWAERDGQSILDFFDQFMKQNS
jgi:puromycin-sensitive aminopeptidase